MLPSLGFQEIILLGVLALVVVGPKDLPLLLRKLGQWTAKLRGMAQEFRTGFDELARQAELDELKKEVDALRRTTNLTDIQKQLARPLGTLESYAGIAPPPPTEGAPAPGPRAEGNGAPEAAPAPAAEANRAPEAPTAPAETALIDTPNVGTTPAPEPKQEAPLASSAP